LTFSAGAFVVATVLLEFQRGARVRRRQRGERLPLALARLVWRNKRRFGGYVVHVGVVLVFIGIAGSSAYKKEAVHMMSPGQMVAVDDYYMRYEDYRLEAVDDYLAAVAEISVFDRRGGDPLARLQPEQRYHPNMIFGDLRQAFLAAKRSGANGPADHDAAVARVYRMIFLLEQRAGREVKTTSTEVAILSAISPLRPAQFGEDFYVTPLFVDPSTGQANFRVFVNPMVNFIWLGGLVFVLGAHLSVLPDARERRRLEGVMALEASSGAAA
jgi:cytochrome c-type biogenesis protein CcmF